MIVQAVKSILHRASQQAGGEEIPLGNSKAPILQHGVQCVDILEIGVLRIGECSEFQQSTIRLNPCL